MKRKLKSKALGKTGISFTSKEAKEVRSSFEPISNTDHLAEYVDGIKIDPKSWDRFGDKNYRTGNKSQAFNLRWIKTGGVKLDQAAQQVISNVPGYTGFDESHIINQIVDLITTYPTGMSEYFYENSNQSESEYYKQFENMEKTENTTDIDNELFKSQMRKQFRKPAKKQVTKQQFTKEFQLIKRFFGMSGKKVSVAQLHKLHNDLFNLLPEMKWHKELLKTIHSKIGVAIYKINKSVTDIDLTISAPLLAKLNKAISQPKVKAVTLGNAREFKGKHYIHTQGMNPKQISELVRIEIEAQYPKKDGYKFSVTTQHYNSIRIEIRELPFNPFSIPFQIYYIDDYTWDQFYNEIKDEWNRVPNKFNEKAETVQKALAEILDSYNRDNSDIQSDYFDVRFYSNVTFDEYNFVDKYYPNNTEHLKQKQWKQNWEEKTKKRNETAKAIKESTGNFKKGDVVWFNPTKIHQSWEKYRLANGKFLARISKGINGRGISSLLNIVILKATRDPEDFDKFEALKTTTSAWEKKYYNFHFLLMNGELYKSASTTNLEVGSNSIERAERASLGSVRNERAKQIEVATYDYQSAWKAWKAASKAYGDTDDITKAFKKGRDGYFNILQKLNDNKGNAARFDNAQQTMFDKPVKNGSLFGINDSDISGTDSKKLIWSDSPHAGGEYAYYKLGTILRTTDKKSYSYKLGYLQSYNAKSLKDAMEKIDIYTETQTGSSPGRNAKKKVTSGKNNQTPGRNAKKKVTGSQTLSGIINKVYTELRLEGEYAKAFVKLYNDTKVMIWGMPGHGKTVWLLKFAQWLAEKANQKVLYVANEEYGRSSLQEKINDFKIGHDNLFIVKSLEQLKSDFGMSISDFDCVFCDSINTMGMKLKDFKDMIEQYPDKMFFIIVQSIKAGGFRGGQEWEHEVDVAGEVHNRKLVLRKNRLDPSLTKKIENHEVEKAYTASLKKAELSKKIKQKINPKKVVPETK